MKKTVLTQSKIDEIEGEIENALRKILADNAEVFGIEISDNEQKKFDAMASDFGYSNSIIPEIRDGMLDFFIENYGCQIEIVDLNDKKYEIEK